MVMARRKAKLRRWDKLEESERIKERYGDGPEPFGASIADCLRSKWPQARDEEGDMAKQCHEITLGDGTIVFYSYQQPIGFKRPNEAAIFTDKFYSTTTSTHRNQFLDRVGGFTREHGEFLRAAQDAGLGTIIYK